MLREGTRANYETFRQLMGQLTTILYSWQPRVDPCRRRLSRRDREQLVQDLITAGHLTDKLMDLHAQAFRMSDDAIPHWNMRRGKPRAEHNPTLADRDEALRQEARTLTHLTNHSAAQKLHRKYHTHPGYPRSVKQYSRILAEVIPPHVRSSR